MRPRQNIARLAEIIIIIIIIYLLVKHVADECLSGGAAPGTSACMMLVMRTGVVLQGLQGLYSSYVENVQLDQ